MVVRPFLMALAVLLLAAPAFADRDLEIPEIPFEFYTLDNGLEVILHEDHSTPIVGVNIWYHVGSKNEVPGRSGFAHLFEHMMFQGSEHQDGEYIQTIQGLGGLVNGSTSEDRTNYWEVVPPSRLESALLLEADRMGWLLPAMTQEKFENQQDVVRNERRQSEGRPYSVFFLNFNENFYPQGHPYDHSVIGIHEDLENATLEDVKDFFRTYYTPTNATLSIAGDFDPAQVKEWVEAYFGPIPPGQPIQEAAVWIPELIGERRIALEDRVQLTRVYWAWHTPPYYHDGDSAMDFACNILGQGRSSRLNRRLVHEEQLAQDVSFSQNSQQLASVAILRVTLAPGADQAEVERIVHEEIARFVAEGPTERELKRVRNDFQARFITGIQRIGSWGGINDRLNRYNHFVGTPDYFQQDYERYASLDRNTVQSHAQRWLGPNRMVCVVSPFGEPKAMVSEVDRTVLPESGDEPPFAAPALTRGRLDNGLQLVVMEQHDLPMVRMDLVFRSGGAADPQGLAGLSSVTAGMLFEGTSKHDKFEFEDELDFLGSDLWYWTDTDRTVLSLQTLSNQIDASMALAAEALLKASFPRDGFDLDKQQRIVSIGQESDQPTTVARKVARSMMFGKDHPYGRLGSGSVESMEAITLDDARSFAEMHYVPGNATLIAVGDVTLDELTQFAERHFGDWSGEAPPPIAITKPEPRQGRTVYLVDKPGDSQATVSIAQFGIPRNHEHWETVYVANRILGGAFSSRLNLNLREDKGYTYGVRSLTWEAASTSLYTIGGRVQREVTGPALTEFIMEYEGAAGAEPFTSEELEFARDAIVLSYAPGLETVGQLVRELGDQLVYGLPDDDYVRFPERVAGIDLETLNGIAQDYLDPENAAIVVVGDLEKIEAAIRELDLGPIRYCDREGNLLDVNTDYSSQ